MTSRSYERINNMAVAKTINEISGIDNFADFEESVYDKYQKKAEHDIVKTINSLLINTAYIKELKAYAAKCGCKFHGFRNICITLKSGRKWEVPSPVFLKAPPKKTRGRNPKRQKGRLRHLGLELLGILKRVTPAFVEVCVSMAVLCPSFEVAVNALKGFGIKINQTLLQNITHRFADLAMTIRTDCHAEDVWTKPGASILICVDGGRCRERRPKRGKRKKGQKRQGYHSEWFEPKLLSITQFDENGKKLKSISPVIDGSCGTIDAFFDLLKQHLLQINLDEASNIIFCADNGPGIWTRTEKLIKDLDLETAKCIIDYTHAKQNIDEVTSILSQTLKMSKDKSKKLSCQIKDLLWNGNIGGIEDLVKTKLSKEIKTLKTTSKKTTMKTAINTALKKLSNYFGDHSKFQYKTFQERGLPTGSGSIESAIRRIINIRVKGAGIFWEKEKAENIIFLRSLVLTGKLKNACRKTCSIVQNMCDDNKIEDLPMTA